MKKFDLSQDRDSMHYLGTIYRSCKKKIEIYQQYQSNCKEYQNSVCFVDIIDRVLDGCSHDTKIIIQHDFLERNPTCWYESYFSRSSYYRLKDKAILEFLDCLEI